MKYGYARVSTDDQKADLQIAALKKEGCDHIFTDIISGTVKKHPVQLIKIKAILSSLNQL